MIDHDILNSILIGQFATDRQSSRPLVNSIRWVCKILFLEYDGCLIVLSRGIKPPRRGVIFGSPDKLLRLECPHWTIAYTSVILRMSIHCLVLWDSLYPPIFSGHVTLVFWYRFSWHLEWPFSMHDLPMEVAEACTCHAGHVCVNVTQCAMSMCSSSAQFKKR